MSSLYANLADKKFSLLVNTKKDEELSELNLSHSPSTQQFSFTNKSQSKIVFSAIGSDDVSDPQITRISTPPKMKLHTHKTFQHHDDLVLNRSIDILTGWISESSGPERTYFRTLCLSAKHALECRRDRNKGLLKCSVEDLWSTSGVSKLLLPALVSALEKC